MTYSLSSSVFASQGPGAPSSGFNFSLNGSNPFSSTTDSSSGSAGFGNPGGFQGNLFSVPSPTPSAPQLEPQSAPSASQPRLVRDDPTLNQRAGPLRAPNSPFLQDQSAQLTSLSNSDIDMSTDASAEQGRALPSSFNFASIQSGPSSSLPGLGVNQPQQPQSTSLHFNQTSSQPNTSQASPSLFNHGQSLGQPSASLGSGSLFGQNPNQQNGTSAGHGMFNPNHTSSQENPSLAGTHLFSQNSGQPSSIPATSSLFNQNPSQQTSTQPNVSFSSQPQQQLNIPNPLGQASNQQSSAQSTSIFFNQPQNPQSSSNLFSFSSANPSQPANNIFAHLSTPQPLNLQQQTSQYQNAEQTSQSTLSPPDANMLSPPRGDTSSAIAQSQNAQNSIFTTMNVPQQQSTLPQTNSVFNNANNLTSHTEAASASNAPLQSEQNGIFANVSGPQKESTPPNTLGGHLISNSTAPLTESSSANMQQNMSTHVPNGIQGSADSSTADQVLNTTSDSTKTSLTREQIETLMPPSIPAGFTTEQARQYVTAYRIRSLNASFRAYVNQNTNSAQPFSTDALLFYQEKQQEILAAGGLPMTMSGVKRKSIDDGHNNDASPQNKRVNVNGTVTNGNTPNGLPLQSAAANNKRKADENIFKEAESKVLSGTAKKARGDSVTYPSLPSAQTSETASLFQSIANNKGIGSKPNNIQHDPVNGQMGSPSPPKPVGFTVSQPTPKSSAAGSGLRPEITFQSAPSQGSPSSTTEAAKKSVSNEPLFRNNAASTLSSTNVSTFKPSQPAQLFTSSLGNNTSTTVAPSAALPVSTFDSAAAPSSTKPVSPDVNPALNTASSTAMKSGTSSGFSLPKFSTSNANHMAQFGQAAKKTEKEEKAKRKAETFDSDEEDEAEWERKDEEEQRAKRQKIEQVKQAAQAEGFKFVLGTSTDGPAQPQEPQSPMPQDRHTLSTSGGLFSAVPQPQKPQAVMPQFTPNTSVSGGLFGASGPATSIFSTGSTASNPNGQVSQLESGNIFGYLSAQGSDAEGSKTGDADNEESDEDEQQNSSPQLNNAAASGAVASGAAAPGAAFSGATAPETAASGTAASEVAASGVAASDVTSSGAVVPGAAALGEVTNSSTSSGVSTPRSLFERIETNADGTPKREVQPPSEKEQENTNALNSFFSDKAKKALNNSWTGGGSSIFSQVPPSQNSAANVFGSSPSGGANTLSSQITGAPATSDGSSASFSLTSGSPVKPGNTSSLFGQATGAPALFTGFVSSAQNKDATKDTSSTGPQFDRTWKVDSPIKFSGTSNAPIVNITAPSPFKPPVAEPKPTPLTNLFGSAKTEGQSHSSQPQFNLFGTSPMTSTGGSVGFQFGASPSPSLFASLAPTSALNSTATSRATSPGASTGAESANEGNDDNTPPEAQIDLANTRAGEEDEDILFEVKAKALEYDRDPAKVDKDNITKEKISPPEEWLVRGVGSLRVLKHRETGKTRMILRAGPGGKIILNTALMSGTNYKLARDKSVMFMAATKAGTLAKWTITVGKKDDATRLANILEQNKSN